jgi:hypothetical protein
VRRAALALAAVLALLAGVPAAAQSPVAPAAAPRSTAGFAALQGRWVRSDGRYVIHVTAADDTGKLAATYSNPNLLPFWTAQASRENGVLKVFLELRAGGYNGSTYTLAYDAVRDELAGVYYQAVARESYNVRFVRSR